MLVLQRGNRIWPHTQIICKTQVQVKWDLNTEGKTRETLEGGKRIKGTLHMRLNWNELLFIKGHNKGSKKIF